MSDREEAVVVGAWARVDPDSPEAVRRRLDELAGVSTFDLEDSHKLGILIEATSLDEAYRILRRDVEAAEGVLGAWPASVHLDTEGSNVEQ